MKRRNLKAIVCVMAFALLSAGCGNAGTKQNHTNVAGENKNKKISEDHEESYDIPGEFKQDIYIETYHAKLDIYTKEGYNTAMFAILSKEKLEESDVQIKVDADIKYDTIFDKAWDENEEKYMPSNLYKQYMKTEKEDDSDANDELIQSNKNYEAYKKSDAAKRQIYAYEVEIRVKEDIDKDETIQKLNLFVKGKKYEVDGMEIRIHNGTFSKLEPGEALASQSLGSYDVMMNKDENDCFDIPQIELQVDKDVTLEKVEVANREDVSIEDISINLKKDENIVNMKFEGGVALKKKAKASLDIRLKDKSIGSNLTYASNYVILMYYKYKGKEYVATYQVYTRTKRTRYELFAEKNDGLDLTNYYKDIDKGNATN